MVPLTLTMPTITCAEPSGSRGRIAQLVEQGIENPRVGGSNPSLATTPSSSPRGRVESRYRRRGALLAVALAVVSGCGDRCDRLCERLGDALATCRPASLTWNDLGARTGFVNTCQDDWDRARSQLASAQASAALDACDDTSSTLEELSCEELVALYAQE